MIELIGWAATILIFYKIIKKIFFKRKVIKNEIILDSYEMNHFGPFSGSSKFKK